jgi:hypothetical protein
MMKRIKTKERCTFKRLSITRHSQKQQEVAIILSLPTLLLKKLIKHQITGWPKANSDLEGVLMMMLVLVGNLWLFQRTTDPHFQGLPSELTGREPHKDVLTPMKNFSRC